MCTVDVSIPDAVLYDTHMSAADARAFARQATALALYKGFNVSLGYCSQIAGMSEADFILYLGTQGVSIFQYEDETELVNDVAVALHAAKTMGSTDV